MTQVGAGGVVITHWKRSKRYAKEYSKLTADQKDRVNEKLDDLKKNPRPPGLGFEKLKGHNSPDIYTIHITGNYKVSFEIHGQMAWLRRVANHKEIDRAP